MNHLPALPILIPLFAASIALFFEHRRFGMVPQRIVAWTSIAAMLAVTCMLIGSAASGEVSVYLLGDWPARLGIVLMVDRLSALMLVLTSVLALGLLPLGLGHTLYNAALRRTPATQVNLIATQEVTGGVLLGVLLLGEIPSLSSVIGALITLLGIALVLF